MAVSSFTAGALVERSPATVLPPGLSQEWFDTLVGASGAVRRHDAEIQLVTVFRLADWRDKGLPVLLDAMAGLKRQDLHLTICGSGEPPTELLRLVQEAPGCDLRVGLTDVELAEQLAAADLCVLASRTRGGRRPYGEGFGLVLLEAQVAGTPVIAPAHGGCYDAYVEGVTGTAPRDESSADLQAVLELVLADPMRLAQMSKNSSEWARQRFAPDRYGPLAISRLL